MQGKHLSDIWFQVNWILNEQIIGFNKSGMHFDSVDCGDICCMSSLSDYRIN